MSDFCSSTAGRSLAASSIGERSYRFHIRVSWPGIGTIVGVSLLWRLRFKQLWKRYYTAAIQFPAYGTHLSPLNLRSGVRNRDDYAASWIRRFPLDASARLLCQQHHEPRPKANLHIFR